MNQPTAAQDARFIAMTGTFPAVARTLLPVADLELLVGRTTDGTVGALEIVDQAGKPLPTSQILTVLDHSRRRGLHVADRTAEAAEALGHLYGSGVVEGMSTQDPASHGR